ncbi:MAG TPA: acetyl-CoA C-acetyltransferase [bacterium]|nr:acetyl-CoA C-acetyltransferase [bacterium]
MKETVVVGAARTPVGSFLGALGTVPAPRLGAIAIKAAVERAGGKLKPEMIDEVLMGCVLPAAQGQAPARQAMIYAGLPASVGAVTLNKVCGSGMRTAMLADSMIRAGDAEIVVAGGMESMSLAPYALPGARTGLRMGPSKTVDTMVNDGLWDPYQDKHMGSFADLCGRKYGISREEQDLFAKRSYERAIEATAKGYYQAEIVAVEIPQKKGAPQLVEIDEEPQKFNWEKMRKLPPAFNKDGTVTAGNASSLNDGAAAMVLMSRDKANELGIKPLASIIGHAVFAQEPEWFTTAPAFAMKKALKKAGLAKEQIDLWEINEAFSVQVIAAAKEFGGLDWDKVNVNGGGASIGHPIGCSGARILVTLIYALQRKQGKLGVASLCIGGGEGTAMIIRNEA